MTPRLVLPTDVGLTRATQGRRRWAEDVLSELQGVDLALRIPLHPGFSSKTKRGAIDFGLVQQWADSWSSMESRLPSGCVLVRGTFFDSRAPHELAVTSMDSLLAFLTLTGQQSCVDGIERMRRVAGALAAVGADLDSALLSRIDDLSDADVEVLAAAVAWFSSHDDDIGDLTERQIPVPGMDTKWIGKFGNLLRSVTGSDVRSRMRSRTAVAHVTYVDPDYLTTGARRHDAWTAGDAHLPAYEPRVVVVVENRDCRLYFPEVPGCVVVEGGGKAATWLLADAHWIRAASHVVYWGDMDADGYEILDRFRRALAQPSAASGPSREVTSILMDDTALDCYAHLGVTRDARGRTLEPRTTRLESLTDAERTAYFALTTAGATPVRRIEQERLPLDVAAALVTNLAR